MVIEKFCLYIPERLSRAVDEIEAHKLACRYVKGRDARITGGPCIPHMTVGEIACLDGHREILGSFLEDTDADWAIVMEDDALLHKNPETAFRIYADRVPDADLIVMHDASAYRDGYGPEIPHAPISYVKFPSWGTVCYAINRRGAQIFLKETRGRNLKADVVWREPDKVSIRAAQLHPDFSAATHDRTAGSIIEQAHPRG